MTAIRTLWRWTEDHYPYQTLTSDGTRFLNDSEVETINPGERCDWAADSVYESLGYCVPCASV